MSRPFAFSLESPLLKGNLLKQGGFGKLFKKRYFVLYPGFLVYYNDVLAWRSDVARGDTLGNRIGAVYLKGATCRVAENAPKGCRYGFNLQAPDPRNKRQSFLLNASERAERDAWLEAITQATPQKKRRVDSAPPLPATNVPISCQDAVEVAAVVGVSHTYDEGEEAVTNMDASILPGSGPEEVTEDPITDQLLKPQSNEMDNDSDRESPTPEDVQYTEEQAVIVFGDTNDDFVLETTIPKVVLNTCEAVAETLEAKNSKAEPSEISWCSEDGCSVTQEAATTYSINVANTCVQNSSQYSDTSDSCGEEDMPKAMVENTKNESNEPVGFDDTEISTLSNENKDSKIHSQVSEGQSRIHQEGDMTKLPKQEPSSTFVQKRGFIYKLGGKRRSWKLRYFVLYPGYFCYYKDPSVPKPIGKVKLKNVSVTESDSTAKGKQPYQFVVHTESTWNNRCDWILAAIKAEELQDWITAFRLAGQQK